MLSSVEVSDAFFYSNYLKFSVKDIKQLEKLLVVYATNNKRMLHLHLIAISCL